MEIRLYWGFQSDFLFKLSVIRCPHHHRLVYDCRQSKVEVTKVFQNPIEFIEAVVADHQFATATFAV